MNPCCEGLRMCLDCVAAPISILTGARGHASGRNRPRALPVTTCAPLATGFLNNPGYNGRVAVSDSETENGTQQGPMCTKQCVNRHQTGPQTVRPEPVEGQPHYRFRVPTTCRPQSCSIRRENLCMKQGRDYGLGTCSNALLLEMYLRGTEKV